MSDISFDEKLYIKQYKDFHTPTSYEDDVKKIYDNYFAPKRRYNIIEKILNKSQEYNILVEIGSGGGSTLKYYSENYNFKKIIGIDFVFSDTLLKSINNKKIELINGNFNNDINLEDNSVDCLILMMIIEHLFDPFHSFAEVRRLLSRKGLAFINLPLVTSVKNRFRLLCGNVPVTSVPYKDWFKYQLWDGAHLHYFSINSIKKICKYHGLEIIKMQPVGKLVFLKKLFPSFLADEISFCLRKI